MAEAYVGRDRKDEKNIVQKEPVLTAGVITGIILALASFFGVVIEPQFVEALIVVALPIVTSAIARQKVTPVEKV
jgi:hypothetical protein